MFFFTFLFIPYGAIYAGFSPVDIQRGEVGECRRATQPKANVVFVPIGHLVLAVLVLRPSRFI